MEDNIRWNWDPTELFEITGEQLSALMQLGDVSLIPYSQLNDDIKYKIYGRFLIAKENIIEKYSEAGRFKVVETPTQNKAKAKAKR